MSYKLFRNSENVITAAGDGGLSALYRSDFINVTKKLRLIQYVCLLI